MTSPTSPTSPTSALSRASILWRVLVVLTFIGTVTVNALANILPINGITTGAVSDSYPTYFAPAGYVFAIWGVIYLALLVFSIAQARSRRPELDRVRPLFAASNVVNGVWILAWHHRLLTVTVGLMLALLVLLILVYRGLRAGGAAGRPLSTGEWITQRLPFSIYLGWISVATIANISAWLLDLGWSGAPVGGPVWSALMMAVATVVMLAFMWREHDAVPGAVLAWALVGLIVKYDVTVMRGVGALMLLVLVAGAARTLPARQAA